MPDEPNDLAARFTPDYTPEQLESLGVYDSLYRGQGPRLASLGAWKPEWISEHDPKGWAQWYKRYASGRRIPDEDARQMKRWLSFKARHGGPFAKNPTPRRGWALRNWGIDPAKLVTNDPRNGAVDVNEMLDEYKRKAMQKHIKAQQSQAALMASSNPERQIGSEEVKQAETLPQQQGSFGQQFGNAISGWANNAIQTPMGQTALGGVAHAYNNYMPQAGKDVVKKMVPHYSSPDTIQQLGMQGKWQPDPFVDKSFEQGFHVNSNDKLQKTTTTTNGVGNVDKQLSNSINTYRPVQVTGTPLQQVAHGISGGVMPGQTFQPGSQAFLHENLSEQHNSATGSYNKTMTQHLTPSVPSFQKQNAAKQAELLPEVQLQEHQQRIADRVTGGDNRLLVYHGLGSGKSLSALAAAEAAKKVYGDQYGIVVPAALKGNFDKEVKKFTTGSEPEIMSYTGLGLGKQFQTPPQTLVMDEAHRLRNPGGSAAQAASREARSAKNLLLLTGSPVTNSPTDLANLLSLLHNKKITPEQFEERFIGYKNVSPGVINWFRGIQSGEQPVIKNESELRSLLRGKVDYQPSKTPEGVNVEEEVVNVPLSPAQQKIQKAVRTKIPPGFLWKLDREFPLSRDELAKLNSFLTGLRQVSISTRPFRADKDPEKAFEQSAKLQRAFKDLQETLKSDERKKAIIYSNHIDAGLAPYAAALGKNNIPHALFHGSISARERQRAVNEYNEGKLRALLIGPAGAEGLSTKGTSLIQLLDPHWHESRSQQAKGRGLRFDSHRDLPEELKNVAVKRYISSSEEPSWLGKLMGYQRERTGDEILETLAKDKEMLNEKFRQLLREEGAVKAGAVQWFRDKEALNILPFPGADTKTTKSKGKKKKTKREKPIISNNALAGAAAAGAASLPLMSLHQDAFQTYPILRERVRGLSGDELFYSDEIVNAKDRFGNPLIQHGAVGTYFGKPQGWFKEKKPNFSKLTMGGEWTSGTGTFHGMLMRPVTLPDGRRDVQLLEGGDAFPEADYDPKDRRFLTSPVFEYIKKRDAEDAARGLIPKEHVGLYGLAKRFPLGTETGSERNQGEINPLADSNLRDLPNNTSGGVFNRNFKSWRDAFEGGEGEAAKLPFFKRWAYYNQQYKRQQDLVRDYLKTVKPEDREKVWGMLSDRKTSPTPILVTQSHQIEKMLRDPETAPIVRDRVNKAYSDYAYRPYDLFSAIRAGAGRVFFPKIAPEEKQPGFNPTVESIPAKNPLQCNEDYCVVPAAETLKGLGVPIGVTARQSLPADLAAGSGFGPVGLIVPRPSVKGYRELYGDSFFTPTKDKLQALYGNDAPVALTGKGELAGKQREAFEKDWAEMQAKMMGATDAAGKLTPEAARATAKYKEDFKDKALEWMRISRNRRVAAGLVAAGLMGAAGYGGTKLIQGWLKKRREQQQREEAKKKRRPKKTVDKMVAVSKAAAAQYFAQTSLKIEQK